MSRSRTTSTSIAASRIDWVTIPESRLGVLKRFGIYRPPGYADSAERFPVLYLFRGHEREWAGTQDGRPGLVKVLDGLIEAGRIGPMLVVLPGFMEPSRKSQGVPVNWSAQGDRRGVGNGRFEDHFFEVKSLVERRYKVKVGRRFAALDGFSMGGYASMLLATKHPHLFGSAGAYDGSFMWPRQIDPRRAPAGRACRLWFSETCAPYFRRGGVWDRRKMERHNPIALLSGARGERLRQLRSLRFHVRAAGREKDGNVDRTLMLHTVMSRIGAVNTFTGHDIRLDPDAMHTWKWADRHLRGTLILHDGVFRQI